MIAAERPEPPRETVSACIIARDEEQLLPACLASVAFCDEIVVVDSGSRDGTVALSRAAGARVVEQPWLGYSAQRNVGLDHATGDWVLEIDADERVTPELRTEIEAFVADPPDGVDMGGLPCRELFLGGELGPASKYPYYRHRFFRREAYRHDEARTVHEGLVPNGPVWPFTGDLTHILATGWAEAARDAWAYARLEAGHFTSAVSAGRVATGVVARPLAKFAYRVLVDGGWRDGWRGLTKIALDCASDSVVWLRIALGRRGSVRGRSGIPSREHFGRLGARRRGPVKIVGCAAAGAADEAVAWLDSARAAGADVVLATDASGTGNGAVRRRGVDRAGPLELIRALSAEDQLRTIDALVAFGPRARALVRLVPPALRGVVPPVDPRSAPEETPARVQRAIPDEDEWSQ
jgi:glycosyltransferase involved in cell wall biosynthesis